MPRAYTYPDSWLLIIYRYLEWKTSRYENAKPCFTYDGIMNWISRHPHFRTITKTTLERVIRKLASDGWVKRVRERPKALFCVDIPAIEAYLSSRGLIR